jgi:hypothetical protein
VARDGRGGVAARLLDAAGVADAAREVAQQAQPPLARPPAR